MLTELVAISLLLSVASFVFSAYSIFSIARVLRAERRLASMADSVVRSVMEEGGDASAEAVMRTAERIIEMDDGTISAAGALKQAREMLKR